MSLHIIIDAWVYTRFSVNTSPHPKSNPDLNPNPNPNPNSNPNIQIISLKITATLTHAIAKKPQRYVSQEKNKKP